MRRSRNTFHSIALRTRKTMPPTVKKGESLATWLRRVCEAFEWSAAIESACRGLVSRRLQKQLIDVLRAIHSERRYRAI